MHNSDERENVFGDGLNLVLALGRIKDIETRLVLSELVITKHMYKVGYGLFAV